MSEETVVTIPLPAGTPRPFDLAAELEQRAAAEGIEPPLSRPLSRAAERVAIAIVAAVVLAGTALAFSTKGRGHLGVGCLIGGVGGAVVAALVWAHVTGGFDKKGRAPSPPAAESVTATVAPALDASVLPGRYRLASVPARIAAGLLDLVFALLPVPFLGLLRGQQLLPHAVVDSLFVLVLLAGPLWLWATNGRTPGRKLLGLRVVRTDGMRMTLRRAFWRELGGAGRSSILSLASMGMDDLRRSSADRRAGTVVVVDDGGASGS